MPRLVEVQKSGELHSTRGTLAAPLKPGGHLHVAYRLLTTQILEVEELVPGVYAVTTRTGSVYTVRDLGRIE